MANIRQSHFSQMHRVRSTQPGKHSSPLSQHWTRTYVLPRAPAHRKAPLPTPKASTVQVQDHDEMAQKYITQGGSVYDKLVFWQQMPRYLTRSKGPSGFGSGSTAEQVASDWNGMGKVVVVTGATSGLGAEATRVLAGRGATVVMMIRDLAAADKVRSDIISAHPQADIRVIKCELDSLVSVASAAQEFIAMKLPLNILMLNAAVMACPFALTKDGIEMQIGVNHVAHSLLTRLLLPTMMQTASAPNAPHGRIVSLTSVGHSFGPAKGMRARAKMNTDQGYDKWLAYGQAKLANLLFARELAVRLKEAGITNIDAVAVHPGIILSTSLWRHLPKGNSATALLKSMTSPFFKDIPRGAATQVYGATAPSVVPGEYYQDCNIAPSSHQAHDAAVGNKLWAWTEEQVASFVPKGEDKSLAWWGAERIPVPEATVRAVETVKP